MDEYQGMERFDVDNDFEGGRWIDGEYFYNRKKDKRASIQTKDHSIYGSFIDSDSDDSDADYRSRKKGRLINAKPDFTKPVAFVSIGNVMPTQEIEKNTVNQNDTGNHRPKSKLHEEDELARNLNTTQGLGLGFSSNKSKLLDETLKSMEFDDQEEDDDAGSDDFLPTAFGRRIKEGAQRRKQEMERAKEINKTTLSSSKHSSSSSTNLGKFENHSRGIASKLMKMMGYEEGSGLGKNKQGIVAPVEVKLRPKNMGMGFNDYKESKLPALDKSIMPPELKNLSSDLHTATHNNEKLWSRKKKGQKTKKMARNYITADELLAQKQDQGFEVLHKVLDMRGPQVRVLANLENLNAEEKAREAQIPMPELQHNVRLIVDMAGVDIQKIDGELRRERETAISLQQEKEKLRNEEARQKRQLDVMESIVGVLDSLEHENTIGSLTMESVIQSFAGIKERNWEDYKLCNLGCIACSLAYPLLIRVFQGWQPLQTPSHGLKLMASWKDLLEGGQPFDYSDSTSASFPYTQLVSEVILPAVRISGTNSWLAKDPEPMIHFLESWEKLLPLPILHSILDNVVMPKLFSAVESWDPCRDSMPIHMWIHPWLPYLRQKLEVLYHTIRFKLGNVLHAWHAHDASAYIMLSPWKDVFDAGNWEQLIVRYIVPKLMIALQEFQINPNNQNLDHFNWVMRWASVIPIHHMVTMLEVGFFTKWKQVVYTWLSSNPNFNEVMQWFLGWKSLFPPELLANERIRLQLNAGLDMMNQAVDGMQIVQPGARENINFLRVSEKRQFEAQQQQAAVRASYHNSSVISENGIRMDVSTDIPEMTLKETVEAYAVENGLTFVPKVGRTHNGLSVYGFGNVSMCVDPVNQVLFAQRQDGWRAVSLDQLLEMHHSATRR
ncbi:putative Tuftelin interacting protein [Zostera marina]|uniref:Putative Tuftelin interacting protein n=1 Tax=Zostera marina TaxID=29655 RepID=A0A0K9NQ04_ZOSMR|nr:putative Tuftelin interacting protein [Zostera marina]